MINVLLTVACYTISSLGDKYISAKLKSTPPEFAFIVAFSTMIWIGAAIPFMGWGFLFNARNILLLLALTVWKLLEFYTSAALLKAVSAYELKAWLGINIVCSYYYNVFHGIDKLHVWIPLFTVMLLAGIIMITGEQGKTEKSEKNPAGQKMSLLFLLFIASKFLYGMTLGQMTQGCKATSVLFLVMFLTAFLQLPKIQIKEVAQRKGMLPAFLTRIPNAAGLILEAFAAMENLFFYAMIQPMQLAILFLVSLVKKEPMGRKKLMGSLLCISAVCMITVLIYLP